MGLGLRMPPQFDLFEAERNERFDTPRRPAPDARVVALVDDDDGARTSTTWFLEGEGYRVLPYPSGDAFLRACVPDQVSCVLLDLRMPGRSGLDVLRALVGRENAPPVVVLTGHADLATAVEAMKLKAADIIEKPYPPEALMAALGSALARHERSRAARAAARDARVLVDGLSERQRQVLAGIVDGKPNKIIAWQLGLSVRTVEAYRAQLFERLGARSTAEAVRIAVAAGVGGVDSPALRRAA